MRRIGTLEELGQARKLLGYLRSESIDSIIDLVGDDDPDGPWDLWVRDESAVDQAREAYQEFLESPDLPKFDVAPPETFAPSLAQSPSPSRPPQDKRIQGEPMQSARQASAARELDQINAPLEGVARQQRIPVVIGIIVVSVVLSLTTSFGKPAGNRMSHQPTLGQRVYQSLKFVDEGQYMAEGGDSFASVRRGQVWRFITPMFLHGDEFHLAFNMLWIFFLGSAIERLHGSIFFAFLVLLTQLGGMLLQVGLPVADWLPEALHGNANVIGASGAVYGLFAFLWIRPMVDGEYPIHLVPTNVAIMLAWLLICMTPLVSGVANGAHLGGLLAGMGLGAMRFFGRYSDPDSATGRMTPRSSS